MVNRERQVKRVNRALEKHRLKPLAQCWPIEWVRFRGKTVGKAVHTDNTPTVQIAEQLCTLPRIKDAEDIYAHELIHHALAANQVHEKPHGRTFKAVAYTAGLRHWEDNTWRYKHTCPACGYWVKTHQRGKRARTCPKCPVSSVEKRSKDKLIITKRYQLLKVKKLW